MAKRKGFSAAKRGEFTPLNKDKFFVKHNSQNGGKIIYRSSWELEFMKWCDHNDNITKIASEPFHIPYIDYTGKHRKYFPDFLVVWNNKMLLLEIKPHNQKKDPTNVRKFAFAEHYAQNRNMEFMVLTERELKTLIQKPKKSKKN